MVFHIRPDFDVVETPDATLIANFIGKKNPRPTEEQKLKQKISSRKSPGKSFFQIEM